jgi:hypothetical protein
MLLGAGCVGASAATYYVATPADGGSDANPGTVGQPFASWQKGHDVAIAGDIIYLRGGVYTAMHSSSVGVLMNARNGTSSHPITMQAYRGETPILDCSALNNRGARYGLEITEDYWVLKGFTVKNVHQYQSGSQCKGIFCWNGSHNRFERLTGCYNEGSGMAISGGSGYNEVKNCDAHHNYDYLSGGDDADGFALCVPDCAGTPGENTFTGCRSWWNSDDGWDLWDTDTPATIDRCWAFWNGYRPGTFDPTRAGNGNGFKMGRNTGAPLITLQRCLSFENLTSGVDNNGASGGQHWYNNTAFNNAQNQYEIVENVANVLRNNIAYSTNGKGNRFHTLAGQAYNSWDLSVTVDCADFVSSSSAGTDGPREADGSLPNLSFLKLTSRSDLRDAGANVGLPYRGAAPDLGAYESPNGDQPARRMARLHEGFHDIRDGG